VAAENVRTSWADKAFVARRCRGYASGRVRVAGAISILGTAPDALGSALAGIANMLFPNCPRHSGRRYSGNALGGQFRVPARIRFRCRWPPGHGGSRTEANPLPTTARPANGLLGVGWSLTGPLHH